MFLWDSERKIPMILFLTKKHQYLILPVLEKPSGLRNINYISIF